MKERSINDRTTNLIKDYLLTIGASKLNRSDRKAFSLLLKVTTGLITGLTISCRMIFILRASLA